MVCLGILLSFHILIPYSVPQYVGSALITFVSAEVLEGNFGQYFSSTKYWKTSSINLWSWLVGWLTFRCELITPISSHVIKAFSWDFQWWIAFDRSWNFGPSGGRWNHNTIRLLGSGNALEYHLTSCIVHMYILHSCHLLHLQLSLLIVPLTSHVWYCIVISNNNKEPK